MIKHLHIPRLLHVNKLSTRVIITLYSINLEFPFFINSWSFGVLMWEVVTLGGTPYSETGTEDLYTQLMSGTRLQKPVHCAQPVYDVMSMCWESIPQHRPMFFEINDHLENMNLSKMVRDRHIIVIILCYIYYFSRTQSYLDLRNYNDTAYSQFEESERQQTSIL